MMAPEYIDSHAHLYFEDYKEDLEVVLSRARKSGVKWFIVPGTDVKSSQEAIKLAEQHDDIYACVGVHPHESAKATDQDVVKIEQLSMHQKVVAIGEIGLDYHYDFSPRDRQREVFAKQIEIAVRRNLPVVIHTRKSMEDALDIIKKSIHMHPNWKVGNTKPQRGVFHCFPGTVEEATYLHGLGFYVSYPGIVTFKKSESIDVVKQIGVQNLLLETDSPYMTPVPLRGTRNEPTNILFIGKKIAEVLGISEEEVARVTTENAIRLFGLLK
jgi:TatD DNase family protein